jgi:hypothetical protein
MREKPSLGGNPVLERGLLSGVLHHFYQGGVLVKLGYVYSIINLQVCAEMFMSWNFHINVVIECGIPIRTASVTREGLMCLFAANVQTV